jgi:hypothetical protein
MVPAAGRIGQFFRSLQMKTSQGSAGQSSPASITVYQEHLFRRELSNIVIFASERSILFTAQTKWYQSAGELSLDDF